MSIKDKPSTTQSTNTAQSTSSQENQSALAALHPVPSGTTAATVSRVRALYDFQPSEPGELQFRKGDVIAVLESVYKDWWKGSLRGQTGIFPLNYVEKLSDPTQEELQREAQMESEVFAEIKNVEKLLTLLSTSSSELNVQDNDEITTLYHSTLAIRPKLIELIGKYSQKKGKPFGLISSHQAMLTFSKMISRNLMKSSSKLEETTNPFLTPRWLIQHNHTMDGCQRLRTVTHCKIRPWDIPKALHKMIRSVTIPLARKV